MSDPHRGAERVLRMVGGTASGGAPGHGALEADADAALRLFWFPRDADDDSPRALLVGVAHRLAWAIAELRADARLPDLTGALEACEYHLENLALRLTDLRELLIDLVDLAGDTAAGDADRIALVLVRMDDALPVRDVRSQRVLLHLNVRVEQRLCDPRAAARALRGAHPARRSARRRLTLAVRAALHDHADRANAVLALTLGLLDPSAD